MEKTINKECVGTPTLSHLFYSVIHFAWLHIRRLRESEISERGSRCKEKRKTEYAMTVKQLLSVYGWVFRQRKESC